MFIYFLNIHGTSGQNQFAFQPELGARDALADLAVVLITVLAKGKKLAVYYTNVARAFDRVKKQTR